MGTCTSVVPPSASVMRTVKVSEPFQLWSGAVKTKLPFSSTVRVPWWVPSLSTS